MKKLIFIFYLFLIPFFSLSQKLEYEYIQFPTSGVIWTECYNPGLSEEVLELIYERYMLTGEDTIINEVKYKKIYLFHEAEFDKNKAECIGGIREDENRLIYYIGSEIHDYKPLFYWPDKEIILFDFSIEVGDTIDFSRGHYNIDHMSFLVVEKIDTIEIGGKLRKQFHFEKYLWTWIEGLGSKNGLLFFSGDLPTNGMNNYLICFEENRELLYMNSKYENCWPSDNSVIEYDLLSAINISPNPVTNDILLFDLKDKNIFNLIIYNSLGREIESHIIYKETEFKLNTENYRSGIYFYKAFDYSKKVYSGKFIVKS